MQLTAGDADDNGERVRWLIWAARLHEIGINIAHSSFHKHGAYILENADMPGFARRDQSRLARLVRASRGGLDKLGYAADDDLWPLILCLRLATLFSVSRSDADMPEMTLRNPAHGACQLVLPRAWLASNLLTQAALENELKIWQTVLPVVRLTEIKS
jgi:exopolyphosphatase/guanosine-5'-triphosphate,3'-diphosphate pyrophosphatase